MTAALAIRDLNKNFGALAVARDICLELPKGARHALIGPNGAGKTTLVNLITGVLRPSAGAILLDLDLTLEIRGHALELRDHGLDLRDLAPFLVDLKLLQANKRLTGLHRLLLPRSHMAPQKTRAAPQNSGIVA